MLGVALADGWWAGRLGLTGSSAQFGTRTSAIWQLHLEYADGTTEVIASGADVRSAPGPWALRRPLRRRAVRPSCRAGRLGSRRLRRRRLDAGRRGRRATTTLLRPFTGEPIRRVLRAAGGVGRRDRRGRDRRLRPGDRRARAAAAARHDARPARRDRAHRDARRRRLVVRRTSSASTRSRPTCSSRRAATTSGSRSSRSTASGTRGCRVCGASCDADDIVAVVIASDHRADRLVHDIRCSSRPPAPERRVESARQLPLDARPTARSARSVGWTGDIQAFVGRGEQQRAGRAVPLALARQPARRPAARWPHPDLLAALAVRCRGRRGRAGRRLDRRRRRLERRDRDRAVDAL